MKKFYESVQTVEVDGQYRVHLDGRPVRTPLKALMTMPTATLADLSAKEWNAQKAQIDPNLMPVTKLITTVIDLMPERRLEAQSEVNEYSATDMLCYRADAPVELVTLQHEGWQTWLDWSATELDAPMLTTTGIEPVRQPSASLAAIERHVAELDDWRLVGCHAATKLCGSAVLGLAMTRLALSATRAKELALLDEIFEIERWGLEAEQAKRHAALERDLLAAEQFIGAL